MVVTAFGGDGFSRHSCEQGVYPLNQNTVRRIHNKGGVGGARLLLQPQDLNYLPKGTFSFTL